MYRYVLILLASALATLTIFTACGDDDDDDNNDSGGNQEQYEQFCERVSTCGLNGYLESTSWEACLAEAEALGAELLSCVLAAVDCESMEACFSSGDDDDDTTGDDDDNDTAGPPCNDALLNQYAAYCPDYNDPCVATDYEYNYDNDEKDYAKTSFLPGELEAMMFKLEAPFHIQKIKLRFMDSQGAGRVHLYADMLGSVPQFGPWSSMIETIELTEPIDIQVDGAGWVEVDVSDRNLLFLPGEKIWVGFEHLQDDNQPYLYYSHVEDPLYQSRYYQEDNYAEFGDHWGYIGRFYMMRLVGQHFCQRETDTTFSDYTAASGADVTGQGQHRTHWTDLNGDGLQDIILTHLDTSTDSHNIRYFQNDGDGTFTERTAESGLDQAQYSAVSMFVDYDNDGDADAFAIVQAAPDTDDDDDDNDDNDDDDVAGAKEDHGIRSQVYLNDGSGQFTLLPPPTGLEADVGFSSAGFGDYDRDGYLDLYIGSWLIEYPYAPSFPDYLYHNDGAGKFVDVSEESNIRGEGNYKPCYGVTWVDYNEDGWYDIFVSNYGRERNFLLENQTDGTFIDVAVEKNLDAPANASAGNTFGTDFGDWNGDGYFDAMMSEIAHPRYLPSSGQSSINLNDGPPDYTYTIMVDELGYHPDEGDVDPSFVDYNNDGRLDLYMSSLYTGHYSRMYEQQDDGTMLDVTYWTGVQVHACTGNAFADFDGDGDLDLLSAYNADGGGVKFFRNDLDNGNHWLEIKLVGVDSNRDAIGAKVTITVGSTTQTRYVQGPRGHYGAQPMLPVHFGLGLESVVDQIEVRWPTGEVETWTGVTADQLLTLTEGNPGITK